MTPILPMTPFFPFLSHADSPPALPHFHEQWNAARRDPSDADRRSELENSRTRAETAEAAAADAELRVSTAEAQSRLVLRELKDSRAALAALQLRVAKRSTAQLELEQLQKALAARADGAAVLRAAQESVVTQLQRERRVSEGVAYARRVGVGRLDEGVAVAALAAEVRALEAVRGVGGTPARVAPSVHALAAQVAKLEEEREGLIAQLRSMSQALAQMQAAADDDGGGGRTAEPVKQSGGGFKFKLGSGRKSQPH